MTAGLDFMGKRDALFNLVRHRTVPHDQAEQIRTNMQMVRTFSLLHDDIIHSVWIQGKPPNSIGPVWLGKGPRTAIKALHRIETGGKEFVENYGRSDRLHDY